jgi:hypothetical protein
MKSRAIVIAFLAAVVAGGLTVEAFNRVAGAQVDTTPAPVVVAPAAPAQPVAVPVVPAPVNRTGYSADDWVKIIGALGILVGAIGGLVVTITGNRARAEEARYQRAQLGAIATATGAPVIAPPSAPLAPTVAGPPQ